MLSLLKVEDIAPHGYAIERATDAGGQPNQYVGDGMLALFGLSVAPATACRQAMSAAANVAAMSNT